MHDSIALEAEGIPTAAIATTAFTDAAEAQAQQLGMPEYRIVTVPHPVQNCTPDEMRAHADHVLDEVIARLLGVTSAK